MKYIRAARTFRSFLNVQIGPHHDAVKNYGSIIYHDNSNYHDISKHRAQWQEQRHSLDTEQYDTSSSGSSTSGDSSSRSTSSRGGSGTKSRYVTHILTIATDNKRELEILKSTATISGVRIGIIGLDKTWTDYSCKLRWYHHHHHHHYHHHHHHHHRFSSSLLLLLLSLLILLTSMPSSPSSLGTMIISPILTSAITPSSS